MTSISSSSSAPVLSSSSASQPSEKSTKRKLEDAIHSLDQAVGPSLSPMGQPPQKRIRIGKSLYATLEKYGIKKETKPANDYEKLSKTAPHLAAILSRTATRTRRALPFRLGHAGTAPQTASSAEYRPSSMQSLMSRLGTFKLSTYANKPSAIDAVAAAKCGWINDGKDRLVCGICDVSWVVGGREGLSRDAANALVEKQRASLVDMHKDGCPWKTRQCDPSIYRIPLQAPSAMAKEIKSRAVALDTVLRDVKIKHPLTAPQVQSLLSTISSVSISSPSSVDDTDTLTEEPSSRSNVPDPSETAVITALFGWAVLPPSPPSERARTVSLSRATSAVPSTPARTYSRAPSVLSVRDSTPTPSTPVRPRSIMPPSPSRTVVQPVAKADTTLLHCALCQRRVGLWAFLSAPRTNGAAATELQTVKTKGKAQPKRTLDVLREHRSYCPYVVRSTVVASLPAPSPVQARTDEGTSASPAQAEMEGWRAVLTVVLRHGMARRQRFNLNRATSARRANGLTSGEGESGDGQAQEESAMEVDHVEAMMAGVKSRGGKELLKYVKGLLA